MTSWTRIKRDVGETREGLGKRCDRGLVDEILRNSGQRRDEVWDVPGTDEGCLLESEKISSRWYHLLLFVVVSRTSVTKLSKFVKNS